MNPTPTHPEWTWPRNQTLMRHLESVPLWDLLKEVAQTLKLSCVFLIFCSVQLSSHLL